MDLHVAALFTHDSASRLLRINEPNGRGGLAPRFFIGRTLDDAILRVRADVDEHRHFELRNAAGRLTLGADALTTPLESGPFSSILEADAPVAAVERGPAFLCPPDLAPSPTLPAATVVTMANAECLRPLLPEWLTDVPHYQPMLALMHGDEAVALCCSVRRTARAHEAGVETAPSMRGRGYALAVVSAWAEAVRSLGQVPLYSTSWANAGSRAVARRLELIQFGNDLHLT
jgi:hypothetical protein